MAAFGDKTISYPESSGSLASGWSSGETLGNSKKKKFFDWLPRDNLHCFYRRNPVVIKFHFPRVSPGDQPLALAKEPEASGYEIVKQLSLRVHSRHTGHDCS